MGTRPAAFDVPVGASGPVLGPRVPGRLSEESRRAVDFWIFPPRPLFSGSPGFLSFPSVRFFWPPARGVG
jgi:hypothetical protein